MTKISNNYHLKALETKKGAAQPSFGALNIGPRIGDKLSWLNAKFNTPGQRIVIGASAMFLQPVIDLKNKRVDDTTRQAAASRSFSRAIIGTISGIAVRGTCIELGKKLSEKGRYCFIDALKTATPEQVQNYSKAVGNAMALAVLLVTNFIFDVPLINKMSAYINEKIFGHKPVDYSKEVKK